MSAGAHRAGWKVAEVAAMFDVHPNTVRKLISDGVIPVDRFGTDLRVPNAWVQERRGVDLNPEDLQAAVQRAAVRALDNLLTSLALLVRAAGEGLDPTTGRPRAA